MRRSRCEARCLGDGDKTVVCPTTASSLCVRLAVPSGARHCARAPSSRESQARASRSPSRSRRIRVRSRMTSYPKRNRESATAARSPVLGPRLAAVATCSSHSAAFTVQRELDSGPVTVIARDGRRSGKPSVLILNLPQRQLTVTHPRSRISPAFGRRTDGSTWPRVRNEVEVPV